MNFLYFMSYNVILLIVLTAPQHQAALTEAAETAAAPEHAGENIVSLCLLIKHRLQP